MTKRIIIAGSRTFTDYLFLKRKMDKLTAKLTKPIILSGHAQGADQLGERWAFAKMFTVEVYHADWEKYGKKAGPIRNQEMVEAAGKNGVLVAFHESNSPGTRDIIERAKKQGLKTIVFKINGDS